MHFMSTEGENSQISPPPFVFCVYVSVCVCGLGHISQEISMLLTETQFFLQFEDENNQELAIV